MELIKEFNDLVEKERSIVSKYKLKYEEVLKREFLLKEKEEEINLKEKNISSRELSVASFENVINSQKDAQSMLENAKAEKLILEDDRKKWNIQVQSEKAQIEEQKRSCKREADDNEKNRKNIEVLAVKRAKEILSQFGHAELAEKL
jgi:uncharacterized protein (DUF2147 family)